MAALDNVSGQDLTRADLDKSYADLISMLNTRQNPVPWFDISAALLNPGRTGNISEALGGVGGALGKWEQQNRAEELPLAKMKLELQQGRYAQQQALKGQQAFQDMITPDKTTISPSDPRTAGMPGSTFNGPANPNQAPEAPNAPQLKNITINDALAFGAAFPEQKAQTELLVQAAKMGSDRYKVAMNGTVFDSLTGKYLDVPIPGQTASEFLIPEAGGTVKMLPSQYSEYQKARRAGQGKQWYQDFSSPTGGATDGQPLTTQSIEAQAASQKATAEARAKSENDRYQIFLNNGQTANEKLANYTMQKELLKTPGMDQMLGYFERPDVASAIGKLISEGRFGVDSLREVLTNFNAPQDLINNKRLLDTTVAQTSVNFRQLAKGQGAISDRETNLFASLGPTEKDPLGAFNKKVQMLEERAKFDRDLSSMLKKSKMNADDFVESDAYRDRLTNYYKTLQSIVHPAEKSTAPSGALDAGALKARRDAALKGLGG